MFAPKIPADSCTIYILYIQYIKNVASSNIENKDSGLSQPQHLLMSVILMWNLEEVYLTPGCCLGRGLRSLSALPVLTK